MHLAFGHVTLRGEARRLAECVIGATHLVAGIVDVVGAVRVLISIRMTRANLIVNISIVVVLLDRLGLAGKSDTDWGPPHALCHPQRVAVVLQELC